MSNTPRAKGTATDDCPSVEILLLNWNGRTLLELCLPALVALDYPNCQLVLLDNASTDDSVSFVKQQFPQVKIIANGENLGYSRGMNVGLKQCQSDIIVLLNNDVVVRPDWLKALVLAFTENEAVGIAGSKLLFPDGQTLQHAGARQEFPLATGRHYHYREKDTGQADTVRDVDYVTGASMAIARTVLDKVGIFDEGFSPFYFEEVDLCRRARAAGYRILYVPTSVAIHDESASVKQVDQLYTHTFFKNRLRFVLKHYTEKQFLEEFVPAEIERLGSLHAMQELLTVRRAYLEVVLALPEILSQYHKSDWIEPVQTALLRLREAASIRHRTDDDAQRHSPFRAELEKHQVIHEFEFTSNKPVIGPVVATLRRAWNEVSTKWYVRAVIQQQMAFNALVARLLDEQDIQAEASASDISLLANDLINMQQQFENSAMEIRKDIAQLQEQLNRIEQLVANRDDISVKPGE